MVPEESGEEDFSQDDLDSLFEDVLGDEGKDKKGEDAGILQATEKQRADFGVLFEGKPEIASHHVAAPFQEALVKRDIQAFFGEPGLIVLIGHR